MSASAAHEHSIQEHHCSELSLEDVCMSASATPEHRLGLILEDVCMSASAVPFSSDLSLGPDEEPTVPEFMDLLKDDVCSRSSTGSYLSDYETAFAAGNVENRDETPFYLDSGASRHMTPFAGDFQLPLRASSRSVVCANAGRMSASSEGEIYTGGVSLKNALLIPQLKIRLFSASCWLRDGVSCGENRQIFLNQFGGHLRSNGTIVSRLTLKRSLFRLNTDRDCNNAFVGFDSEPKLDAGEEKLKTLARIKQLHRKWGHPGRQVMRKMSGMTVPLDLKCEACIKGKTKRIRYRNRKHSEVPLEILHGDLNGPHPMSLDGHAYFSVLVDEGSRFVFLGLHKSKDEVAQHVINQVKISQRQLGLVVKKLHSDNGSELVTNELMEYTNSEGIVFSTSPVHNPELNGLAERVQKSLLEKCRCLLSDAKLPMMFWSLAMTQATLLYNLSAHSRLEWKSPWSILHGEESEAKQKSKLKIFGCSVSVYPQLKDPLAKSRIKFEARALQGIYVGDGNIGDTINVYLSQFNKVRRFHDYVMNEDKLNSDFDVVAENSGGDGGASNKILEHGGENAAAEEISNIEFSPEDFKAHECESLPVDMNPHEHVETGRRYSRRLQAQALKALETCMFTTVDDEEELGTYCFNVHALDDEIPKNVNEAFKDSNWKEATFLEYQSLFDLGTFEQVRISDMETRRIPVKWLWKIKKDASGNILKWKARLVVCGNCQNLRPEGEFNYAPVIRKETLRMLIHIAVTQDIPIAQADVSNAFVQSPLGHEDVYIGEIPGFACPPGYGFRLKRSLYGLRAAPKLWNSTITEYLIALEYRQSTTDACLFIKTHTSGLQSFIGLYVDDLLILGVDNAEVVKSLEEKFKITSNPCCNDILGMKLTRSKLGIHLSMPGFIEKVSGLFAEEMPLDNITTAVSKSFDPTAESKPSDQPRYASLIGALQWISTVRPDTGAGLSLLSRFVKSPTRNTWKCALRMLKYLLCTKTMGITFLRSNNGHIPDTYTDSNWGSSIDGRSTSGYLITGCGPLAFRSKIQASVALSSCEAEIVALSLGATELIFFKKLWVEIFGIHCSPWKVHCDNRAAIDIAGCPRSYTKLKHVSLRHFYVQELVESKEVEVVPVCSADQYADGLTKILEGTEFKISRSRLGVELPEIISGGVL
jgi:transposase InsO family protein